MKIADYKGYEIHLPTSGGKAGKGCAHTSTIQVRKDNIIQKQVRFIVADSEGRRAAIHKARVFCDGKISENNA